jgi:hypothetical protein
MAFGVCFVGYPASTTLDFHNPIAVPPPHRKDGSVAELADMHDASMRPRGVLCSSEHGPELGRDGPMHRI